MDHTEKLTFPRPLRALLLKRLTTRILEGYKDKNYTPEQIDSALAMAEAEHRAHSLTSTSPIIDWLMNGGFEEIFKIVIMILPLFI